MLHDNKTLVVRCSRIVMIVRDQRQWRWRSALHCFDECDVVGGRRTSFLCFTRGIVVVVVVVGRHEIAGQKLLVGVFLTSPCFVLDNSRARLQNTRMFRIFMTTMTAIVGTCFD
jgi:hypothetical protein